MTLFNLTFDGDGVKIRPNEVKFSSLFLHASNAMLSYSKFPHDSMNVIVCIRRLEISKSASNNVAMPFFGIYEYMVSLKRFKDQFF